MYLTSEIFKNIEIIKTNALSPTSIQNIYPRSTGYFGKDRQTCDTSRETCLLCPCDHIVIRDSDMINCSIEPEPSPEPTSPESFLFGCFKIKNVYSDTSTICDDIFDIDFGNIDDTGNIVKPFVDPSLWPNPDSPPFKLGECARLDETGGVDGVNGIFNVE